MDDRELKIANLLKAIELKGKHEVVDYIIALEMKELQLDLLIDEEGGYKRDIFSRRPKTTGDRRA